jgi:dTDP-4-dehydrorhamnose reductase
VSISDEVGEIIGNKLMKSALIGYTGFVGCNLGSKYKFTELYNSRNIYQLGKQSFDLVVCAAPSAVKWQANQYPKEDLKKMNEFIELLKRIRAKQYVQISTVDVYPIPLDVNENSPIASALQEPYGKHRYLLENFIKENFPNHLIIRLPGLFGEGMKKNFIFDMLTTGESPWTHYQSVFQFYDLRHLWEDIQTALKNNLSLLNMATEPISIAEVANEVFGAQFVNVTDKPPVTYDMKSINADVFGGSSGYLYNKGAVVNDLTSFIKYFAKA